MKVTLPNGMTVEGTYDQVRDVLGKLGASVPELNSLGDSTHYNSSTKGWILISDMETYHLRNAVLKHYAEWLNDLRALDTRLVYQSLVNGPKNVTLLAMLRELGRRI